MKNSFELPGESEKISKYITDAIEETKYKLTQQVLKTAFDNSLRDYFKEKTTIYELSNLASYIYNTLGVRDEIDKSWDPDFSNTLNTAEQIGYVSYQLEKHPLQKELIKRKNLLEQRLKRYYKIKCK